MKIIRVTEAHIASGKQVCSDGCPVALALRDAGHPLAVVPNKMFWASDNKREKIAYFPTSVYEFIQRFDSGLAVKPFEFATGEPR